MATVVTNTFTLLLHYIFLLVVCRTFIVCSISKMLKIVTFLLSGHYYPQRWFRWTGVVGSISDDLTNLLWWHWSACNSRIYCWIWTEIGQFYGTIDGNESGSISCLSTLCEVRGFDRKVFDIFFFLLLLAFSHFACHKIFEWKYFAPFFLLLLLLLYICILCVSASVVCQICVDMDENDGELVTIYLA